LLGIVGAFAGWVPIIIVAAVAISKLIDELSKINFGPILDTATNLFRQMVTGFGVIGQAILNAFNGSLQAVVDAWNGTIEFFAGIWNGIVSGATGLWHVPHRCVSMASKFIVDGFNGAITAVKDTHSTAS
jgi:hypothetical protein